jgi:glycosyltransferase involved in cell wall biosynthesis
VISTKQVGKDFLASFNIPNSQISRFLVRIFLKYYYFLTGIFASAITVHSNILKEILIKDYNVRPDKVHVIASGVREIRDPLTKPQSPKIFEKFPVLKNKIILLTFGFFSPRKGYEIMIKAFSKFLKVSKLKDNVVLVMAGGVLEDYAFYRKKIEGLIVKQRVKDNVLITGYVNGGEVDELFRLAKVVILPAVITFNISGALAYALAYHKPVFAADTGPLGKEITDNKIGFIYSAKSIESCKKGFGKIFSDVGLLRNYYSNVIEIAKKRYWLNIARQHYLLFKKFIPRFPH